MYLLSPEDVILRKLDWFRRSAGALERQLRDCTGILKVEGGGLDFVYLGRSAEELGVTDQLTRCIFDAGLA